MMMRSIQILQKATKTSYDGVLVLLVRSLHHLGDQLLFAGPLLVGLLRVLLLCPRDVLRVVVHAQVRLVSPLLALLVGEDAYRCDHRRNDDQNYADDDHEYGRRLTVLLVRVTLERARVHGVPRLALGHTRTVSYHQRHGAALDALRGVVSWVVLIVR